MGSNSIKIVKQLFAVDKIWGYYQFTRIKKTG